ncbi:MAG TPA: L,D-transpeptidase family protein [Aestuariivirgaceae bacterium]|nr:L,D-transpeptidase family protein [Aestuariivirgaceae bacterium]
MTVDRDAPGIGRRKVLGLMASTAVASMAAPQVLLAQGAGRGWFGNWRKEEPQQPAPQVAPTRTEIIEGGVARPMLNESSVELMLDAVARYEIMTRRGGWPQLPMPNAALARGTRDPLVPYLRIRLAAENFLPFQPVQNDDNYDEVVEAAVARFQRNHGLHAHGRLDGKTVAALNVTTAARLETLRANLPRVQEHAVDLGQRYVVVNIPGAQLEAVEFGRVRSRHNVVVGMPDRPSPAVSSRIHELNFNPYWHAPVSIVRKDIIPKYLENPNLLDQLGIRVFDGWNGPEIDPRTVDWRSVAPDRYQFRQDPGGENAMASVKINFPNKHSVYMHDTPTKELFTEASRYFSSGCVRVEQVHELTNWILNGQEGWDPFRIQSVVQSGERLDVAIADPPQVRWSYLTSWVGGDGFVNFRDDIYNLDGTGFVSGQPVVASRDTAG